MSTVSGAPGADDILKRLAEETKQKIQALSVQARKEDGACSHGAAGLGGTSVGPRTPEALAATLVKSAIQDAASLSLPVGTMLSIPGVTQVQYDYKGLPNGAEVRSFRISGHLEGGLDARLRLQMDGSVEGDRNLYVEYMVNYRKSRSAFPAWSPFLDTPAVIQPGFVRQQVTTLSAIADFSEKGVHRNGVKPWQEYDYKWHVERIGASARDVRKTGLSDPSQWAESPFGGDWVGVGWGSETRFKETRKAFVAQFSSTAAATMPDDASEGVLMSINVKHQTVFYFHVDFDGNVTGRGVITYTLDPNLCAVAVLTRQVNEQVNFMKHLPAIYLASRQLGQMVIERFGGTWAPTPPTITSKMDEIIRKLPRIESSAGRAEVERFLAANPSLKKAGNMAFADLEVDYLPKVRMWGPSGAKDYRGISNVAPPTPRDAAGNYVGRFLTRRGEPGWWSDGKWVERNASQWDSHIVEGNFNARGNESELRILEFLAQKLPKGSKGTVRLYTQRPPCASCAGVIEQFYHMFPDILLVVTSGG